MRKVKIVIIGGVTVSIGLLFYLLFGKKKSKSSTSELLLGNVSKAILSNTNSSSAIDTITLPVVVPPVVNIPFVEYSDGYKIYDINGNVTETPLMVTLSGDNKNVLTATTNFVSNARQLCYAIDFGDHLSSGNNVGWTAGLPNQLELPADGRVHSLIVGLIGEVWGTDPNTNKMTHLFQMFFRVGGTMNLVGAIPYPSTFQPTRSKLPNFFEQFPDFYLPNKLNHYAGSMPKGKEYFDMRKRGWAAWEITDEALISGAFPVNLNYQTHYDGVFRDTAHWTSAEGMNNSNQAEVEALARSFVQADGPAGFSVGKLVHIMDDEWRQGVLFTNNGKLMRKYFFAEAKRVSPNTNFICHHQSLYKYNFAESLEDAVKPFHANYTLDNLIENYTNKSEHSQDWADISGLQRGDNAGKYLGHSVSAYLSEYNQASRCYIIAQELFINKKFAPNQKVTAVIANFSEVSVQRQQGVNVSWNWQNGGQHEILEPMLTASFCEFVASVSNFIADGIDCWGERAIHQEAFPEYFSAFHSQTGLPEGNTNTQAQETKGTYAKQWMGIYDYVVAGMNKYATIPTSLQSSDVFLPEISLDGGVTWLSGDDVVPVVLMSRKQPMAFAIQNGGRTAVFVSYPINKPTRKYDFHVRVNGKVIPVSVCGQYPEIINI